jgi:formylglycine-generating enzyme required for sulfatase activity
MAGAGTPGSATDTIDEFGALCGGPQDDFEPYGTVAQTGVCNVGWSEDAGCVVNTNGGAVFGCGPLPSTTYPGCVSPGGINAAVGNVQEWVHDCELAPADAAAVVCFRAGGSFATPLANASCSSLGSVPAARSAKDPFTGIRCCADLTPEEQTKAAGP